jgi:hypothetical protein
LVSPDDEHIGLETCRELEINEYIDASSWLFTRNIKKVWVTVCCLKSDELYSLNISSANKIAMLSSADLLL